MNHHIRMAFLPAALAIIPAMADAAQPPTEANCTRAIASALDTLRRPLPDGRPRDETDRRRLLAEMEKLAEDSRRQGLSECQTWSQIMGKAFNQ